jgi:hypothetical protein
MAMEKMEVRGRRMLGIQQRTKRQANAGPAGSTLSAQVKAAFRHPALWLSLAFLANVFEGALRKWVPGFESGAGRNIAYFSKDLLMAAGVLLMSGRAWRASRGLQQLRKWGLPALALIVFGGLLSLMGGFNAVGAILTLRGMLVLPVLAYLYAGWSGKRFPLMGLAFVGVILGVANGVLSLIQNSLPSTDFLNKYAEDEMNVVELATYGVRATGTFAYITGLAVASAIGLWSGMVMISLSRTKWHLVWGTVGILGGMACAFASISRGTVVTGLAMLGLWALSSVRGSRLMVKGILAAGPVGLVLVLLAPGLAERFTHVGEGTFDRFESAGDDNIQRALGQWSEMWHALSQTPLGNGLGTEQVGGNVATKGLAMFTTYESQFPRIVAELGILGFLGFLLMVVAVIMSLQRTKHGPGGARWALVITATQVYLLGQFYTSLAFNHTASAFVWMTVAAVFAAEPVRRGKKRRRPREPIREPVGTDCQAPTSPQRGEDPMTEQ